MVHVPRMVGPVLSVLFVVHVLPMVLAPLVARIVLGVSLMVAVVVAVVTAVLPLVLGGVRHVVLQVLVPSPCCPARR
ncbi:hypothetical protein [Kitasatospora purpeofusca]|uniref:hypothetical protein n=1 Tax=Kitasatospora purpeofusca TaxID=67352 RepID=UPI001428CEC4|nr:hypothetical protein [Kitasatospora purpeofusca]